MRKMIQLLSQIADLLDEILAAGGLGGGSAALTGEGPPDSGVGGLEAALDTSYYDTLTDPPTLYKQTSSNAAAPVWVAIIMGDATA